jgi:hemerythrin-like domain-containing protein
VIESVLGALPGMVRALGEETPAPRAELARFVRFIREYADAYHHAKEEDMLFRAMADAGIPTEGGPVGVMLAEHEQGRTYAGTLAEIAAGEGPLGEDEANRAGRAAGGYVELLTAHIQKEDRILYPMAERILSSEAMATLARRFEEHEAREAKAGGELEALARELAARYGSR